MNYVPYTSVATTHTLSGPHIDWAGLSPLIALLAGATAALLVGMVGSRGIRRNGVPVISLIALARDGGALDLAVGRKPADRLARAPHR